jgi:hypothetical protein
MPARCTRPLSNSTDTRSAFTHGLRRSFSRISRFSCESDLWV